jgi:hypothetical protein
MKSLVLGLLVLGMALWSGCAAHRATEGGTGQVFYYDRNGDGRVDLEKHHFPKMAEADWELRDDNYDGRYEKKVLYGFTVVERVVDLPVPTNVHIEPNA